MGLDGTRKIPGEAFAGHPVRDYPDLLCMPGEVVSLIEQRWGEYGGRAESGDKDFWGR